jgi:hypothetical protein
VDLASRRAVLAQSGLVGLGAMAGLMAACGSAPASSTSTKPEELEGAWRIDVTLDDGTKHQAVMLFAPGGGLGATAALGTDSFFNGCGAWARSGGGYAVTFEGPIFAAGTFASVLRVSAAPTIDPTGDKLTARVDFAVHAPGATAFTRGGGATWSGSRIKPS